MCHTSNIPSIKIESYNNGDVGGCRSVAVAWRMTHSPGITILTDRPAAPPPPRAPPHSPALLTPRSYYLPFHPQF